MAATSILLYIEDLQFIITKLPSLESNRLWAD